MTDPHPLGGGICLPTELTPYSREELSKLLTRDSGEILETILHRFMDGGFTAWDIRFCIGKEPVRLDRLGRSSALAGCWYNSGRCFDRFLTDLGRLLLPAAEDIRETWVELAVRTAFLFASVGEAAKQGILPEERISLAMSAGNFFAPVSAFLAKAMGLPVEKILCGTFENEYLWKLLHYGTLETGGLTQSRGESPVPAGLEAMISLMGGREETLRYLSCVHHGMLYQPEQRLLERMRQELDVAVLSRERTDMVIAGAMGTYALALSPETALAFGAWQDHQSSGGRRCPCLVLSQQAAE